MTARQNRRLGLRKSINQDAETTRDSSSGSVDWEYQSLAEMAGLKRTKYLTCFYCGRRTSTPYSSHVRQFDCPSCDATNYLDEVC